MGEKRDTTLPVGRVSRQSQRVKEWMQLFFKFFLFEILSSHFEKYQHNMKLRLTEHV